MVRNERSLWTDEPLKNERKLANIGVGNVFEFSLALHPTFTLFFVGFVAEYSTRNFKANGGSLNLLFSPLLRGVNTHLMIQ